MANETIKIRVLENGELTLRDTSSKNVGELRNELEIPGDANVMVNSVIRQNDFELSDDAIVGYTANNKSGGM